MGELDGKVALITGGGAGIGRATARVFAQAGARGGAVRCRRDLGGGGRPGHRARRRARAVRGDGRRRRRRRAAASSTRWPGPSAGVNVLVNNAGVSSPRASVQDLAEAEWHRVLGVNLHGHFYAAKYAVPHLLRAGGGAIVNTASVLGQATLPGGVAYSTSKAALIGLHQGPGARPGPLAHPGQLSPAGQHRHADDVGGRRPGGPRGRGGRGGGEPAAPARGAARGDRARRAVPGERRGLVHHGGRPWSSTGASSPGSRRHGERGSCRSRAGGRPAGIGRPPRVA